MLYHLYEWNHAAMAPLRAVTHTTQVLLDNPYNLLARTPLGRMTKAACEVFERATRRYGKPAFGLHETVRDGHRGSVSEDVVKSMPFCDLIHFRRAWHMEGAANSGRGAQDDPKVLIVAPMSGHYATLLRGTVAAMLPEHDVYITDWRDARVVPANQGAFGLEDYIEYVMKCLQHIGPGAHVLAVCQPGPAVLAATAILAARGDEAQPASMVLMGSPIDPRRSPTVPNNLATTRPLRWFERNVITRVPPPHPGFMRRVYPGFLQLTGFMTMNLDRHFDAQVKLFNNLVEGDGESAEAHRRFYDEYLSVMDLTAEFYLETIRVIFQEHALPRGEMKFRDELVDPSAIEKTALMTVEGEKDDISGIGQTQAAHDLCTGIPDSKQLDYIQPGVGHYGVFNGSRWRNEIQPRVRDFIRANR
ncbi:polyhydroxyalkanoate depolymerase [Haliangium ochraceum]|uniref:Polyhydroxyalkanoate depolymerase, intracellular n=1 Tax=Haliangium ochraceum (strain DSM 14365 / JCM 11303 / SMP-2) TaxID=502025 RepID=D0LJA0_HALO1|nr:polyhydroxyalkanoate depolymerase [Haliangium ochraceum]ACY14947.1 polyhydroxyalkanoate depolymerase, intracellular [Haliangium ochraceum DSM 14365]